MKPHLLVRIATGAVAAAVIISTTTGPPAAAAPPPSASTTTAAAPHAGTGTAAGEDRGDHAGGSATLHAAANKPRASLTYAAFLGADSRLAVVFTTNAKKVKVAFKVPVRKKAHGKVTVRTANKTRTLKVRHSTAQTTLPAGAKAARAKASQTSGLRAGPWIVLTATTSGPTTGGTGTSTPAPQTTQESAPGGPATQEPAPPAPAPSPALVGDIDGNGRVGCSDLAILKSEWGTSSFRSDLNQDGTVGLIDLSMLLSGWTDPSEQCLPDPPAAPLGVFAVPGNHAATIGWLTVPDATSYKLYQASATGWEVVATAGQGATEATVDSLTAGQSYQFALAAGGAGGDSGMSDAVTATPNDQPEVNPELSDQAHVIGVGAVQSAAELPNEGARIVVSDATQVGQPGDPLVIRPSAALPQGMFAKVVTVTPAAAGTTQVDVEPAALDEVFPGQTINMDSTVDFPPSDLNGDGVAATAIKGGGVSMAITPSVFTCTANGIPRSATELWDTGLPSVIQADFTNVHTIRNLDLGSPWHEASVIMQVSGEVETAFDLQVKMAFECKLSASWRRAHSISVPAGAVAGVPITAKIELAFEFGAEAIGSVGFHQHRYWAVTLDKHGDEPFDVRRAGSTDPAQIVGEGELKARVFAGVDFAIVAGGGPGSANATAGFYLTIGPELSMKPSRLVPLCLSLDVALQLHGGIRLNLWVKRWDLEIIQLDLASAHLADVGPGCGGSTGGLFVGDADNFGYGNGVPLPCLFYDLSGPDDLGVFDRELTTGDETDRWTHSFAGQLPAGFHAARVELQIPEAYSDEFRSTITFDGVERTFVTGSPATCGSAMRTFILEGSDASIADDGIIDVVFNENGDNIALDYSNLVLTGTDGTVVGSEVPAGAAATGEGAPPAGTGTGAAPSQATAQAG